MASISTDTLIKILNLELDKDCTDRAVGNGLEPFVERWQSAALEHITNPQEREPYVRASELVRGYGGLTPDERKPVVQELLRIASAIPKAIPRPVPTRSPTTEVPAGAASAGAARERAPEPPPARPPRERRPSTPAVAKDLTRPVTDIRGIGESKAKKLQRLNIQTVEDLLTYFPRRHVDYSTLKTIDQLFFGEEVTVIGTVTKTAVRETRRGFSIAEMYISDDTGEVKATWFNNTWLVKRYGEGHQVAISGKVGEYLGRIMFNAPEIEPLTREQLNTNRRVPIYPLTDGVSSRELRTWIDSALNTYTPYLEDYLPVPLRQRAHLMELPTALRNIHFPTNEDSLERARRRLSFDEFLVIQLGVLRQRARWQSQPGVPLHADEQRIRVFIDSLPFRLTSAQERAIREIQADLAKPVAMSRLLQGDVGAGKTVVAAVAAQVAVANGKQVAIMAPTEILAEQHYRTLGKVFAPTPTTVRLLIGSLTKREKDEVKRELEASKVDVLVGTHALIQEDVQFKDLGLVVIDEQHRFGVEQRASLRQKGWNPHMLVMTATPIPRTLSLTLYGDLDLSILDEMPPGRQPIMTKWREPLERERTYASVRAQVQQGRQAFIICPLVEESDKLEARAAIAEHERLQRDIFPDLRLGLLHGRMKGKEKDEVMRAFIKREFDILVSTSVVEVGIDVPNATVMVVEGANHFGLSQLHQFRGRVGRGEHASYCYLLADRDSAESMQRLKIIEDTLDGFRLAEEDLKMRGPGEFFGTRQSGLPDLKVARIGDARVLEDARREAQELFGRDPELKLNEHHALAQRVWHFWRGEGDLS